MASGGLRESAGRGMAKRHGARGGGGGGGTEHCARVPVYSRLRVVARERAV